MRIEPIQVMAFESREVGVKKGKVVAGEATFCSLLQKNARSLVSDDSTRPGLR